jgi:hypothetical protein
MVVILARIGLSGGNLKRPTGGSQGWRLIGDGKAPVLIFVANAWIFSGVRPVCRGERVIGGTVDRERELISHHLTVARPGKETEGTRLASTLSG